MSSVIELFFGGRYNAWNENYPNATGPYWDGIAAVWGQGAAYSGFATMYKVAKETNNEKLSAKYAEKEETFLNSIDIFLNNGSGRKSLAYGMSVITMIMSGLASKWPIYMNLQGMKFICSMQILFGTLLRKG